MTIEQFLSEEDPATLKLLLVKAVKDIATLESILAHSHNAHHDGTWDETWDETVKLVLTE